MASPVTVALPAPATLSSLPAEAQLRISKLLDDTSLIRLSLACRERHGLLFHGIQERAKRHALPPQDIYNRRMFHSRDGEVYFHRFPGANEWRRTIREPLAEAVCAGRYDEVRFYLDAEVSAKSINLDAVPLLHLSIRAGQYHFAALLLQYNADPNVVCPSTGRMALDDAVGGPANPPVWLIERLLAAGARFIHDLTFGICCTQTWGKAFFRRAVRNGTEILPDTNDPSIRLQAMCKLADMEIVHCLFDLVPGLVTQRHDGLSALDIALVYGREDIAVCLVRRGVPLPASAERELKIAMLHGHTNLVQELLKHAQLAGRCPSWKCAAIQQSEERRRNASVHSVSRQRWIKMIS
ncbi:uncharacterized protein BO97DRAFT_425243 [Aspergillus homomorphus CBS 101889]|uniref:F-box domain-containing protein n=1 Tax=Aspergillus homomorphus (strain CBS 101889) TaxID=1450537 RepID=A0A395HUV7_ASPHC|nr:hypothetical protein BO97DRAFT_425243 [Aspergillus homomorphus CBS 101889]RAL11580.1 hypothetical protein BO97DRAFT_425243 [Aspergillus homomorphus CBS 101889]